ncbi:hypothetical protein NC651_039370 [Populus alba x Populus x berolinensis]|nr:hypothetical protein NC651_039370 [Populus alba x Populus x berolinensis]
MGDVTPRDFYFVQCRDLSFNNLTGSSLTSFVPAKIDFLKQGHTGSVPQWLLERNKNVKECIRIVSEAAVAGALYSASVDDRAVARRLFELHEMVLEPTNVMYTEVEIQSSRLPAQSASEKASKLA